MLRKAVILAAGKGNRLMPFTNVIPKEMTLVNTKPIIEHTVKLLLTCGIKDVVVITNSKKGYIGSYCFVAENGV